MKNAIEVGAGPSCADVAQVGEANFAARNRSECRAFIRQIVRAYGQPPVGVSLVLTTNQHEFGTYREVGIEIEPLSIEQVRTASDWANAVECDSQCKLEDWDAEALLELGLEANATQSASEAVIHG